MREAKRAPKSTSDATKRRVPTQARSLRRYEAIVEAAAEAFTDHGFEATTMEGIAARAKTSIGSLYQFFPNKLAVFQELARRCLDMSRQTFAELFGEAAGRSWQELVDVVIDAYRELHKDPVMGAVYSNLQLYGVYEKEDAALLGDMTKTLATLMAVWAPTMPVRQRQVVATLLVNTVATAMLLISRNEDMADELVVEVKRQVARYLQPYIAA